MEFWLERHNAWAGMIGAVGVAQRPAHPLSEGAMANPGGP